MAGARLSMERRALRLGQADARSRRTPRSASASHTPAAIRRGRSPRPKQSAGSPRGSISRIFCPCATRAPRAESPRSTPAIGASSGSPSIDATISCASTRSPIERCVWNRPAARRVDDSARDPRRPADAARLRTCVSRRARSPRPGRRPTPFRSRCRHAGRHGIRDRRRRSATSCRSDFSIAGSERLATRASTSAAGAIASATPGQDHVVAAIMSCRSSTVGMLRTDAQKHAVMPVELRRADVPGIDERHAAPRPRRIGVVDQHDRAGRAMQRVGDRRSDIAAPDHDDRRSGFAHAPHDDRTHGLRRGPGQATPAPSADRATPMRQHDDTGARRASRSRRNFFG